MSAGDQEEITQGHGCISITAYRPILCSILTRGRCGKSTRVEQHMHGAALVTSLLFLTLLAMLGLTAVSTTLFEFLISANHRNASASLHLAEGGVEHARETLRVLNAISTNPATFTDELQQVAGNNGVLNGFANDSDDLPFLPITLSPLGKAHGTYTVYLTNDAADQSNSLLDSNARVTLIAIAEHPSGAQRMVENVVMRYPGPALKAALYGKDNVSLDGAGTLTIDGHDRCLLEESIPPIYTLSPALTERPSPSSLLGIPAEPQQGSEDIDIQSHLTLIQTASTDLIRITADQVGTTFGDASHYVTVYANPVHPSDMPGLRIMNGVGYGNLLVEGDLTLGGHFEWHGLILVTGHLTLEGGGGNLNIRGAILTQGTTVVNGNVDVQYNSCAMNHALNNMALTTVSWRETY